MASKAADILFHRMEKLSYKMSHGDEVWEYSEEPHVTRRREILKKYPQIKKLMGADPLIAYVVAFEFVIQIVMCYFISVYNPSWGLLVLLTYVIGATINHSFGTAIHEIGHNLAFGHKYPLWNRALGMFSNLCMVVPFSVTYKKYHTEHHRWLGHDTHDVDIPTQMEGYLFRRWWTKCIWLFLHPIIHALRPFFKDPKPVTVLEFVNIIVQVLFDLIIFYIFGLKAILYLAGGTLFGFGFHPTAGHFISEHYLYNKGQATHSYYGPLNPFMFNVGYHVEHHDFPYIAYNKLPEVKRIAAEYYDNLPYHTSWVKVLWDFIFDTELGPHARGVGYHEKDVKEHKDELEKQKLQANEVKTEVTKEHANGCLWSDTPITNGASNGLSNGLKKLSK